MSAWRALLQTLYDAPKHSMELNRLYDSMLHMSPSRLSAEMNSLQAVGLVQRVGVSTSQDGRWMLTSAGVDVVLGARERVDRRAGRRIGRGTSNRRPHTFAHTWLAPLRTGGELQEHLATHGAHCCVLCGQPRRDEDAEEELVGLRA